MPIEIAKTPKIRFYEGQLGVLKTGDSGYNNILNTNEVVVGEYNGGYAMCYSRGFLDCLSCPIKSDCPNPFGSRVSKRESIPLDKIQGLLPTTKAVGKKIVR